MKKEPSTYRDIRDLSPEARRDFQSKGGKAMPAHMRPFARDPELARTAGRKGGLVSKKRS